MPQQSAEPVESSVHSLLDTSVVIRGIHCPVYKHSGCDGQSACAVCASASSLQKRSKLAQPSHAFRFAMPDAFVLAASVSGVPAQRYNLKQHGADFLQNMRCQGKQQYMAADG